MTADEIKAAQDLAMKWRNFPGVEGTLAKLILACTEEIQSLQSAPCRHDLEQMERAREDSGYF